MTQTDLSRTMVKPIRISVIGIKGRIGEAVHRAAHRDPDFHLCYARAKGHSDPLLKVFQSSHIVVDFSHPDAAVDHATAAAATLTPLLIGTTGMNYEQLQLISVCNNNPVIITMMPNVTDGMLQIDQTIPHMAAHLGPLWHCTITDTHHPDKLDSPSATALNLSRAIKSAMLTHRSEKDYIIEMISKTSKNFISKHEITFTKGKETITIIHNVTSLETYAKAVLTRCKEMIAQHLSLYGEISYD